jgi:hypothetical protein
MDAVVRPTSEQVCPRCGASIVHDRAFTPWCAACDWNVDAGFRPREKPSRMARIYSSLGRRFGESLFQQVRATPVTRPRFTVSRAAADAIAVVVIAVGIGMAAAGVWMVVFSGMLFVAAMGAVVLFAVFVGRPRFAERPERTVTRADAPTLYELADRIAEALRAPRVHTLGIDGEWNAVTYRYGLRQRTAIDIGLPFWDSIDEGQRVFVLAHEVAHSVNGDSSRGVLFSVAIQTLETWMYVLEPDDLTGGDRGLAGIATIPINVVLYGLTIGLGLVGEALFLLSFRAGQRAEFYADALAASAAGSESAISGLDRLQLDSAYKRAVAGVATGNRATDLFQELSEQLRITPASELERLRRGERLLGTSLDTRHPPTYQRIEILEGQPSRPASAILTPDQSRRIDAELARFRDDIAKETVEEYLGSIS